MRYHQTNTNSECDDHSVFDALLPPPGPIARAFFRCTLFGSIPVLLAFVVGLVFSTQPLLQAASTLTALLGLPSFLLSFAFIRTDRRLALIGFVVSLLLFLAAAGIPIYIE